jgi:hypothetical protein
MKENVMKSWFIAVTAGMASVCTAWAASELTDPAGSPAGDLILDRSAYFRTWTEFGLMRLNNDVLRRDGEKLFGKALPRLERYVKGLMKSQGHDWTRTDWRDVACYLMIVAQQGDNALGMGVMPTTPPPGDWAKAEFDDSAFDRQRLGLAPTGGVGPRASGSLHRRALYMRTYFQVEDPSKAGELTLRLVYRGGVRVLVNGREIARRHLPAGAPDSAVFGEDYPAEAYVGLPDEIPASVLRTDLGDFIGDLRCPFDMADKPEGRAKDLAEYRVAVGKALINRKGWDRLKKLRNRVLGPVTVPAEALRKGINCLAIEVRSSRYHPLVVPGARNDEHPNSGRAWQLCWLGSEGAQPEWDHAGLLDVQLRSGGADLTAGAASPAGLRVWVDDLHRRLCNKDCNPAGWPAGTARFAGAQNGTFGAQLAMTADKDVADLKVTASDLAGEGGATIPASALRVLYGVGHDLAEMSALGSNRCAPSELGGLCPRAIEMLYRNAKDLGTQSKIAGPAHAALAASLKLQFFDHLSESVPGLVPANTCQPIWLSLKIPADAPPGKYRGTLTVEALGEKATLPLEAEVIGWRVPDPINYQFFMQAEQSPYGIANHYKVELWSPKHWQLMESSFRQLARIGNRCVLVPVVMNSELGNRESTMIGWIRKRDGSLAFDYALLDRYLSLAVKTQGRPLAVCFIVMQAVQAPTRVKILDEATGRTEVAELGPEQGEARRALWQQFAAALHAHMKSLGLDDAMYWGQPFDDVPDKDIIGILAAAAPSVGWTSAGHFRAPDATFRLAAHAYGVDLADRSFKGWSNPFYDLLMTRCGGSVICVEGISTPFTWRVMCDRAIYCGFRGLGRVGADYFDRTWFDGVQGGYWNMVGRAIVQSLWPGETCVDTGTCNEVLLEGIQEAEARIYLEQTLDRNVLPEDLAQEVQAVLDGHLRGTLHILTGWVDPKTTDLSNGWQARSRLLYRTAARVAQKTGLDVDRTVFGESTLTAFLTEGINGSVSGAEPKKVSLTGGRLFVAQRGRLRLALKLRNWSGKARQWKAASNDVWIVPEKPEGRVLGQEELGIVLNGAGLKAGTDVSGTLTVTDVEAGTAYSIRISATVEKGLELQTRREIEFWTGGGSGAEMPKLVRYVVGPVFNAAPGSSESREYSLVNRTTEKQAWSIASDVAAVTVEPAAGELAPGQSTPMRVTFAPTGGDNAPREVRLTLTAADGALGDVCPIKTYVLSQGPVPAVPSGQAVYLNELDPKRMKGHMDAGFTKDFRGPRPWFFEGDLKPYLQRFTRGGLEAPARVPREQLATVPYPLGKKTLTHGLWVSPGHETVYDVASAGFTAFAAEVGSCELLAKTRGINLGSVVNFEIYVDGKLRAQSGMMKSTDAPRLLVVAGLENAKEVKLATRRDDLVNDWYTIKTWGDPRFIKGR